MGIGISVFLLAAGAVLTFAVHAASSGFNLHAIGVILMVVGGIGLLVAIMIGGLGAGPGWGGRRTTVVDDGVSTRRVDTYVD